MNPSSLTGLLVVIAGVVWVAVLIPAWTKQGQEDEQIRVARQRGVARIKEQSVSKVAAPKLVSVARMSLRLSQIRMIFGFTLFGGLVTALVALADATHLWPISLAGFLVSMISVAVTRRATKNHLELLAQSLANRNRLAQGSVSVAQAASAETVQTAGVESAGWNPIELPKPLHAGHIGNLEQPILAEVKKLPVANIDEKSGSEKNTLRDLDEILRRRRNVS